jgi:ubiquitin-like protein ATG12
MAQLALSQGSPSSQGRTLPSSWGPMEATEDITEALRALETYKKKDPSKGVLSPSFIVSR